MTDPALADKASAWGYDTRTYTVPFGPLAGQTVPSITTVIGSGIPKKLDRWVAKTVAQKAVRERDAFNQMDPDAAVAWLANAANEDRDAAASRGTSVHTFAELVAKGEPIDDLLAAEVAETKVGPAVHRFLDEWQPDFFYLEATVFSDTYGYAGTFDFIAWLAGIGVVIGDYKTSRSGIWPEVGLQLAAGRFADWIAIPDGKGGYDPHPIPETSGGVAVLLRPLEQDPDRPKVPPGATVYEVDCSEEQFDHFLAAKQTAEWVNVKKRDVVGKILIPPQPLGERPANRLDEITHRALQIVESALGHELAARWPPNVPTLKEGRESRRNWTEEELDAIEEAVNETEKSHGLPFVPRPYDVFTADRVRDVFKSPAAMTPSDPEQLEAVRTQWRSLPTDLVGSVQAESQRRKLNIKTKAGVEALQVLVDLALDVHGERIKKVMDRFKVNGLDTDSMERTCSLVGNPVVDMSSLQAEKAIAVADAIGSGVLRFGSGTPPTEEQKAAAVDEREAALIDTWGTKSKVNMVAKWIADRHGMKAPRSASGVAADPLLSALVLAAIPPLAVIGEEL